MAELADALDSGSSGRKVVEVQVLLPALPQSDSGRRTPQGCGLASLVAGFERPESGCLDYRIC
jgi:hypothetical protein